MSGSVDAVRYQRQNPGGTVRFPLVGELRRLSPTTVTVPASPGEHTFDGALTYGLDKNVAEIAETTVTVQDAAATTVSATRSISPSSYRRPGARSR